jgi:hypothetical protein
MKKLKIIVFVSALLALTSCSGLLNMEPQSPQILDVVTDIASEKDLPVPLSMELVEVYDINEDDMELVILPGENYTVVGLTVVPDSGFVGDLIVEIQVKDEGGLLSEVKIVIISILPGILEIQPIYTGAEWFFADTFFTIDSSTTSILRVTDDYINPVNGVIGGISILNWINADSLSLNYLYNSSDSGSVRVGGESPNDSFISPQLKLKYPVAVGDSWSFSPLKYSIADTLFYNDSRVSEIRCNSTSIYVTVPAGTFECVEYEYSYDYTPDESPASFDGIILSSTSMRTSRATTSAKITVKLFYAVGVGYVQNLTYLDNTLVIKKVLTNYTVEEKI